MKILKLFTILLLCACTACGGDHHWWDGDGKRRVKEVYITEDIIQTGGETRVDVYFETKSDDFGQPKDIQIVVKLPSSLVYKYGTSKIHLAHDEKHTREPDHIIECEDETSFLVYALDHDDDLRYSWTDRYDISFYAIGAERSELAVIFAQGDSMVDFSCSTEFHFQKKDGVIVE